MSDRWLANASEKTVLASDGLRHIVDAAHSGTNGWVYWFLCGDDQGWGSTVEATDEAPTCLQCIGKQRLGP